jgi:hypothetical protein
MDTLRELDFTAALSWLQGLIGSEVAVTINQYGQFFGCGIAGALSHVDTLPPDHSAIGVAIGGGQGFFLDPADTQAFAGRDDAGTQWLEFRLAFGAWVVVERSDAPSELRRRGL